MAQPARVRESGYGTRWKCEFSFSGFKRLFPETVSAVTIPGMIREVMSRVNIFNLYKRIRANLMGTTGNGIDIGSVDVNFGGVVSAPNHRTEYGPGGPFNWM